jgi:hypothetical protein
MLAHNGRGRKLGNGSSRTTSIPAMLADPGSRHYGIGRTSDVPSIWRELS